MIPALLELRGIQKIFPGCIANDDIDLTIAPGEIHALLGENGAGKSTLVKMIYGVLRPDQGEILWRGESIQIDNPASARALGIGMVFQHFSLFESMTTLENVALALPAQNLDLLRAQFPSRYRKKMATCWSTAQPNIQAKFKIIWLGFSGLPRTL